MVMPCTAGTVRTKTLHDLVCLMNNELFEVLLPKNVVNKLYYRFRRCAYWEGERNPVIGKWVNRGVERNVIVYHTKRPLTLINAFLKCAKIYYKTDTYAVGLWFIDFVEGRYVQITSVKGAIIEHPYRGIIINHFVFPCIIIVQISNDRKGVCLDWVIVHLC